MFLLGGKICELVPLRVLKPEMTAGRVVAAFFRSLNGHRSEKMTKKLNYVVKQRTFIFEFLLGVIINSKPRPQNEILVPFRGAFENFRRAPLSFS